MNAWYPVNPSTLTPGDYARATRTDPDGNTRLKQGPVTNVHPLRVTLDLDPTDGSDTYIDEGWTWEIRRHEAPVTIGVVRDEDGAILGLDWAGAIRDGLLPLRGGDAA